MAHRSPFILVVALGWASVCAGQDLPDSHVLKSFAQSHCVECHDQATKKGGLDLESLLANDVGLNAEAWEKVVRKLAARQMPPPDSARPTEREFGDALMLLETSLDAAAERAPNPGRTETFRRLNRTEYRNAIRDLLGIEIDVAALLPADESSHGFDNVTVSDLSPSLLNRYLSAAENISRLAVGAAPPSPTGHTIRIRPDVTQDSHVDGLPLGTRGGILIAHNFPVDGEYEIQIRLMRDRNDDIESLHEPHELEVLLDRDKMESFAIKPGRTADENLKTRIKVSAGQHKLGVTFVKKGSSLLESTRKPLNVHFNFYRHPRLGPAVYEVSILGPYDATSGGDTVSRRKIFTSQPRQPDDEERCAKEILANLARQALRRPVNDDDIQPLLETYRAARAEGNLETGIEAALAALLVHPQFLFHIERDPENVEPGSVYRISDIELASRLSFFFWSSTPDEELLALAERNELRRPDVLEKQVRRMLADERAQSLATNFAGQWLYLRNLDSVTPDMRLFPDFDDNLRQSLRRETELFFGGILQEDRSVLDLVRADYTYLDERLAKHYGVPHVQGSRFQRVALDAANQRGGLLRHGSVLTVTSYATRTSPVIRGHWILQNLVGAAPPPPPPNVPALDNNTVSNLLPIRERLKEHRSNAACAGCHQQMDPVGFTLENFDAVGRWRKTEGGLAIDAAGGFTDGSEFEGASGLEQALLNRPELFVRTLSEKLLTFALGRGVEHYDAPAVRQIVRDARADNYRFSTLIVSIVRSVPFQMRKAP
jgi:hypothetical protein